MFNLLNKRIVRLILLALAVGMGIWGWINFSDTVVLTHEEPVSWEEYEPGLPAGTYVHLTVQEEEPWLVTSTAEDQKTGFGANSMRYKLYHIFGYVSCKDRKGQPVLLKTTEDINELTELRSEAQWRRDFRDNLRAYAGSTTGEDVYGIITEGDPGQDLDFSYYMVGMPGITYADGDWVYGDDEMSYARERLASLGDYTVVEPFRGSIPKTATVFEGTDSVPGQGRWWMCAAALLLLLLAAKEISLSAFWSSGKKRR